MAKRTRTYSRYTLEAMSLMGKLVKVARTERRLSAQEVADRAGISRGLLSRIEKGDPKCEIGVAFEVAVILGIELFHQEGSTLSSTNDRVNDKLALLPKYARKLERKAVNDDF